MRVPCRPLQRHYRSYSCVGDPGNFLGEQVVKDCRSNRDSPR